MFITLSLHPKAFRQLSFQRSRLFHGGEARSHVLVHQLLLNSLYVSSSKDPLYRYNIFLEWLWNCLPCSNRYQISKNHSNPRYFVFSLPPLRRRYKCLKSRTTKNSYSFFSTATRLLSSSLVCWSWITDPPNCLVVALSLFYLHFLSNCNSQFCLQFIFLLCTTWCIHFWHYLPG